MLDPTQALAEMRAAQHAYLEDAKRWAFALYVGRNGWYHSMHWKRETEPDADRLRQLQVEAAGAARGMRAEIKELRARAEGCEMLADMIDTRVRWLEADDE